MLNIDKVIDEYNENVLEDKVAEELRKEFQSKLHDGEGTKAEVSTNADYFRVLDGTENNIPEGTITTSSTLDGSELYTTISSNIEDYAVIKECDQVRIVKFNKNELLQQLGFYNLANYAKDDEVELKVTIVGRDCDKFGHPIDIK